MTNLTDAQHNVYRKLLRGLSNDEIAAELGIKTKTVKVHLTTVYRKLEVSGDRELLAAELRKFIVIPSGVAS